MANPQRSTYREWTTKLVANLSEYFNLAGWTINLNWDDDAGEQDGGDTIYAVIHVNATYTFADLTFLKAAENDFKSKNTRRLVHAVVHELTHIFLQPFGDWMHDHLSKTTAPLFENTVETQTQKLSMLLLKNLPPELIPPIK